MASLGNFALQLSVGVRDLYSNRMDDIHNRSTRLRRETEQLQQGVADIGAYRRAEQAIGSLSAEELALQQRQTQLQTGHRALSSEYERLTQRRQQGVTLSREEQRQLARLENEIRQNERQQRSLEGSVRETQQALDRETRSLQRLGNELQSNGVDSRQLGNELSRLERDIRDVNRELERTGNIEGLGGIGDKIGSGLTGIAGGLGLATLAGDLFEMDSAIHRIAAGTELELNQAQALEPLIRGVYERLGAPIGDIEVATKMGIRQLNLTGDAAVEAAEKVLMLQQAHPDLGLDTKDIYKAAGQMKIAWGVSMQESADLMAIALEKAGDKGGDLMDTLWEYSPTMKEAGLNAQQFTAMLISGAKAGAFNYDKMADSIKESFKGKITDIEQWNKLIGEGGKQGDIDNMMGNDKKAATRIKTTLAELRNGIVNGDDKAKSAAYAKLMINLSSLYDKDAQKARNIIEGVFGGQGSDDMTSKVLAAMGKGIADPDKVLGDWKGKTQKQFNETITGLDEVKRAGRELWSSLSQGISSLINDAGPVKDMLIGLAQGVASFAKEHPGLIKIALGLGAIVTVVAGASLALGALGLIATGMASGLAVLSSGAMMAGRGALFLGRGLWMLAANPVGAVIAALALGAWALYENWDAVVEGISAGWQWLKEGALELWDLLSAPVTFLWDISPLKQLWDLGHNLLEWWQNVDLSESGKKLITTLASGIQSVITAPYDMLKGGLRKLRNLLPFSDAKEGPLSELTKSGRKLVTTLGDGVSQAGAESMRKPLIKALAGATAGLALALPATSMAEPDINALQPPPEIVQTAPLQTHQKNTPFLVEQPKGAVERPQAALSEGVASEPHRAGMDQVSERKNTDAPRINRVEDYFNTLNEQAQNQRDIPEKRDPHTSSPVVTIELKPHYELHIGSAEAESGDMSEAVLAVLRERDTELLSELELALEAVMARWENQN